RRLRPPASSANPLRDSAGRHLCHRGIRRAGALDSDRAEDATDPADRRMDAMVRSIATVRAKVSGTPNHQSLPSVAPGHGLCDPGPGARLELALRPRARVVNAELELASG